MDKLVMESKAIRKIYSGLRVKHYDRPISHIFNKYKKMAFDASSLKDGDSVLVFCCGTGLDFSHILKKIGKNGKIVGVDFSSEMLKIAQKKIQKNKWENIDLIEADVTKTTSLPVNLFDVGVCTLGISIIPDYETVYANLVSRVKSQGEIIIGDMQLATKKLAILNPITVFTAKNFGGSYEGHQNSANLCKIMENELNFVIKKEFFFKSYFFCIGKT